MLNALSNYLQNMPHPQQQVAASAAPAEVSTAARSNGAEVQEGYVPSPRAIMVSAVASDFDVRALERQEIGSLQHKLQQYGLLNGRDLDAFSLLSVPTNGQDNTHTIDAVDMLDQITAEFDTRNIPFSDRQNISHLHRLMHNLDSARQILIK